MAMHSCFLRPMITKLSLSFICVLSSKAVGLHLFKALKNYAERWGPTIMKSPDRVMVDWSERDRAVVVEQDLEGNFQLCKEAIIACCERSLHPDEVKEIPNLADFEAGFFVISNEQLSS